MTNFNRHLRSTNPRKTDTDNRRRLAGNLNDKQCIARGLADILKCQWLPTRDSTRRLVPVAIVSVHRQRLEGRPLFHPCVHVSFQPRSFRLSLSLSPIPSRYPRSKRTINAKIKTKSSLDISCRINTRMLNIANRFRPSKVISGQIVQQPQEITDGETVAENKQFQFPFTSITVNRRQSLI